MKILAIFVVNILTSLAFAQGPAYPYSVGLTWTLSTSTAIASQNIYRAPFTSSCGVYSKLTTTPLSATATSYNDANPPEGAYCYAATATNTKGAESGFSNIDSNVNIPPPPPTNFAGVVAKNGAVYDVIYTWKNPAEALTGNSIYCNGKPAVKVFFQTNKVRITSPAGSYTCDVTASTKSESGPSNQIKVTVP